MGLDFSVITLTIIDSVIADALMVGIGTSFNSILMEVRIAVVTIKTIQPQLVTSRLVQSLNLKCSFVELVFTTMYLFPGLASFPWFRIIVKDDE